MPFKHRTDAGRQLERALTAYHDGDSVILALSGSGVTVAAEIALALVASLDLILVCKIGVPRQPEVAMGTIVDGGTPLIVRNEDVIAPNVSESEFKAVCDSELAGIERPRERYLGNRERVDVAGHTAIIIDDGIATGACGIARHAAAQASKARARRAGGSDGQHRSTTSRG